MKSHDLLDFDFRGSRMKIAAALITTAVVGAVGTGVSAYSASSAASTQAKAATDATAAADKTQMDMYNQTRDDQAPYRQAGYQALGTIQSDMANGTGFAKPFDLNSFYSDPGYQFTLQQGTNAINNSAAARSGVLNGGTLKALAQYGTGLANQTYGDAYNRYLQTSTMGYNQLAGIAGIGQQSLNTTAAAGTQTAAGIANTQYNGITGAGNARASGYVGVGNAVNSGLGTIANGVNTYAGYQFLNNFRQAPAANSNVSGGSGIDSGYYGLNSD